jgi:hypothetical protein
MQQHRELPVNHAHLRELERQIFARPVLEPFTTIYYLDISSLFCVGFRNSLVVVLWFFSGFAVVILIRLSCDMQGFNPDYIAVFLLR